MSIAASRSGGALVILLTLRMYAVLVRGSSRSGTGLSTGRDEHRADTRTGSRADGAFSSQAASWRSTAHTCRRHPTVIKTSDTRPISRLPSPVVRAGPRSSFRPYRWASSGANAGRRQIPVPGNVCRMTRDAARHLHGSRGGLRRAGLSLDPSRYTARGPGTQPGPRRGR
mgnify:CR=1 FL=1